MRSQDEPLDSVIDDVAREMTAGDASANLRARVMAHIEQPRRFVLWRPAFAALSVAAIVVALMIDRRPAPSPVGAELARPGTVAPPVGVSAAPQVASSTLRVSPGTLRRLPSTVVNPFAEPPLQEQSIAV